MNTANPLQQAVIKRLNAKADSIDAARSHRRKLVDIRCTRISFHCKLNVRRKRKIGSNRLQKTFHLRRGQHGRRSPAYKYGINSLRGQLAYRPLHFLLQRIQISIHWLAF
ncbi:hypothetical protein D3C85_1619900 [compost metagenome]